MDLRSWLEDMIGSWCSVLRLYYADFGAYKKEIPLMTEGIQEGMNIDSGRPIYLVILENSVV